MLGRVSASPRSAASSSRPHRWSLRLAAIGVVAILLAAAEWRFGAVSAVLAVLDIARVEAWLAGAGALAPLPFVVVMALTV
jgi:uncharacterized membrane protein YdjX (TVP38/TMEM64 family)